MKEIEREQKERKGEVERERETVNERNLKSRGLTAAKIKRRMTASVKTLVAISCCVNCLLDVLYP